MFLRIVSILWGLLPPCVALAIWRASPSADLPKPARDHTAFPSLAKVAPWSISQALAYRRLAEAAPCLSAEDEKLVRLVEIRKERFFRGVPCDPAAVLASTLAELGERLGDLRLINTALKLRDVVVGSLPPFGTSRRAFFHDADSRIESALRRLSREDP